MGIPAGPGGTGMGGPGMPGGPARDGGGLAGGTGGGLAAGLGTAVRAAAWARRRAEVPVAWVAAWWSRRPWEGLADPGGGRGGPDWQGRRTRWRSATAAATRAHVHRQRDLQPG